MDVAAAGTRVVSRDDDLVGVETDQRTGDLVVRVVGGADGDRVAGRKARALAHRGRRMALRGRGQRDGVGALERRRFAVTERRHACEPAPMAGKASSIAVLAAARRMNQINCTAEKSAIDAALPSRKRRP